MGRQLVQSQELSRDFDSLRGPLEDCVPQSQPLR